MLKLEVHFLYVVVLLQADPGSPVLAAGDPERINMKKCEEMGGIPYHINVIKYMVMDEKLCYSHSHIKWYQLVF